MNRGKKMIEIVRKKNPIEKEKLDEEELEKEKLDEEEYNFEIWTPIPLDIETQSTFLNCDGREITKILMRLNILKVSKFKYFLKELSENDSDDIEHDPTWEDSNISNDISDENHDFIVQSNTDISTIDNNESNQESDTITMRNENACEFYNCTTEVFSACHKCEAYLCYFHFNDETSYDTCEFHKCKIIRKRKADPNSWKRNIIKKKCRTGQAHINAQNKKRPGKACKPVDCGKCRLKCQEKIDEPGRMKINEQYWALGDIELQKQYLSSMIEETAVARRTSDSEKSRRDKSRKYFLIKNNEKIQVCSRFFLTTFNISDIVVRNTLKKRNESGIIEPDLRGRHTPGAKRPQEARQIIKTHIESFPRIESHYTRKDTKKQYLAPDLNIQKMYDMYVAKCKDEGIIPEKKWLYNEIFHNDYNLSFHHPRKDQCDVCFLFNKDEANETSLKEYENHINRKTLAYKLKDDIKSIAEAGDCHFLEFDMEAVRYLPKVETKSIFYKRRFAVYNLTVHNVITKKATCFVWHEGMAKRGSIEVASCVYKYLKEVADGKSIFLFSDSCGGQNRNINMTAMFLYAIRTLNIPKIDHAFFEPGHSHMECDSVHAHIETASKNQQIYDPSGWYTVMKVASRKGLYTIEEMEQSDFIDFNQVAKSLIKNRKKSVENEIISWLQISWLQYKKDSPNIVYFKYNKEEDFQSFEVTRSGRRQSDIVLKPAYHAPIPINPKKMEDLRDLMKKGIIKQQYHFFYNSLVEGVEEQDDE